MRPLSLHRTAIHEAAHFVFAKKMGLGEVVSATVTPDFGFVARQRLPMEKLLNAEIAGKPLASVLVAGDISEDVAAYRNNRIGFANQLVMEAIAGAAADTELSCGDATIGETDFKRAWRIAGVIVAKNEVGAFMEIRFSEVRAICRGKLRHTILAVAERLARRGYMEGAELEDLWNEVNPANAPSPGANLRP
jgi:hypothetical protein